MQKTKRRNKRPSTVRNPPKGPAPSCLRALVPTPALSLSNGSLFFPLPNSAFHTQNNAFNRLVVWSRHEPAQQVNRPALSEAHQVVRWSVGGRLVVVSWSVDSRLVVGQWSVGGRLVVGFSAPRIQADSTQPAAQLRLINRRAPGTDHQTQSRKSHVAFPVVHHARLEQAQPTSSSRRRLSQRRRNRRLPRPLPQQMQPPMLVIPPRMICARMHAARLGPAIRGRRDQRRNRQHVLQLPPGQRPRLRCLMVEHLVHHIPAPERNDLTRLDQPVAVALDADVAPHDAPQAALDVDDVGRKRRGHS